VQVESPRVIHNLDCDSHFIVSETSRLADMENTNSRFFATPHGKREHFSMHRGQLIVRCTAKFSHGSERRTSVFLFVVGGDDGAAGYPYLFCVSSGNEVRSIRQAQRLIDRILDEGRYAYDLDGAPTP
jgi:hypothetical protein